MRVQGDASRGQRTAREGLLPTLVLSGPARPRTGRHGVGATGRQSEDAVSTGGASTRRRLSQLLKVTIFGRSFSSMRQARR